MIEVTHEYAVELDWMEPMAKAMGGYLEERHIKVPESILSGIRYACPVNAGLTTFLLDVTYHQDVYFKMRNTRHDFIGLYFNLTEGEAIHVMDKVSRPMGNWNYNVAILDSVIPGDYLIKKGGKTFMISIFIKKSSFKESLSKVSNVKDIIDAIFDSKKNTIVRFDRMSNNAWRLMDDLRKTPFDSPLFDIYLQATTYGLIADYIDQIVGQEIILEQVVQSDITNIISSQNFLINHIHEIFPGIAKLSYLANMSETKYKRLFKKITGITANAFFLNNKLSRAKEMLEKGTYTIAEVAAAFSFFDSSHFIDQFSSLYGVTPKEYIKQL